MNIGVIRIGTSLPLFIAFAVVCLALLHFVSVRNARRRLQEARGQGVVSANAKLRVYLGLRSMAFAATVAPLVVTLVYAIAQWRIERSADDPTRVRVVVATRDFLERTLGEFARITAGGWVTALIFLTLIWIVVRYSGSSRRWKRALKVRRKAYEELLVPQSTDTLLTQAKEANAQKFNELQNAAAKVIAANRAKVESVENAQLLSLPGKDGKRIPASIAELRHAIAQFEHEASELESAEQPATP